MTSPPAAAARDEPRRLVDTRTDPRFLVYAATPLATGEPGDWWTPRSSPGPNLGHHGQDQWVAGVRVDRHATESLGTAGYGIVVSCSDPGN